jgi:hypothetical protein
VKGTDSESRLLIKDKYMLEYKLDKKTAGKADEILKEFFNGRRGEVGLSV